MNRLSIALLALLMCAPLAFADDEPPAPKAGKGEARRPAADQPKVTLRIEGATLAEAVTMITTTTGVSIVVDPRLAPSEKRITVEFDGTALDAVLQQIAALVGGEVERTRKDLWTIRAKGRAAAREQEPRVNFVFRDRPLHEVLHALVSFGQLDVKLDPSFNRDQKLSLEVDGSTALEALRTLAAVLGAELKAHGEVWRIEPKNAKPAKLVVQIHSIADLAENKSAAEVLLGHVRRSVPGATIALQGRGSLVVKAPLKEQELVNDVLLRMRQFAAARARSEDPAQVKLRFFDVKDLIHKFHKLPARMKRLFPELQDVTQRNGILIVRGTNEQLGRVGADLDKLRLTLYAGRRNADGDLTLPPPPPPSGAPTLPREPGRAELELKAEREAYERARRAHDEASRVSREQLEIEREAARYAEEALRQAQDTLEAQEATNKELARRYAEAARRAQEEAGAPSLPTEAEWERAARGPRTLGQRIQSLHAEVRALRDEVRQLRELLEARK